MVGNSFARTAMIAPIPVIGMMKLVGQDHCLSWLDRSLGDFGISRSDILIVNLKLLLNCVPFTGRCLTRLALPCNVLPTFIG